jgi:ferredoxin--NADP+ reductase
VPDGPLTSRLQHLQPGRPAGVSKKPTGTLVLSRPAARPHLYLFSTGTGMAPFMSVIQDPDVYERFEKVILIHGVRYRSASWPTTTTSPRSCPTTNTLARPSPRS